MAMPLRAVGLFGLGIAPPGTLSRSVDWFTIPRSDPHARA
jgi:hypothetical protein